MTIKIRLASVLVFCLFVCVGAVSAFGQSDDVTNTEEARGQDQLSDEEMALILESLAADSASNSDDVDAVDTSASLPLLAGQNNSNGASGSMSWLDMAFIADVAGAWYSDPDSASVGAHDPGSTGFNLQQLELSLGSNVDTFLRFDANIVFAEFGVEVEEVYATTLAMPARLQIRAGQFLSNFGRANPTHPHTWSFTNQALVLGKFFGSEGSRGLGAELSWLAPLPWFVEVSASAANATGACCARSFLGADPWDVRGPEDLLYTTRVEQFWQLAPSVSLLWGISTQLGPNASGRRNRTDIYGSDLLLRIRNRDSQQRRTFSLQLEGLSRARQQPDELLRDHGTYVDAVYRWSPRWEAGARYEWVGGVEDDPLDPEWTGQRQRISAQGTFMPSHFSRLRLQVQHDDMSWRERPVWGVIAALEVLVGAHGAHSY